MAGWHIDPINIEDLEKVRTWQRRRVVTHQTLKTLGFV